VSRTFLRDFVRSKDRAVNGADLEVVPLVIITRYNKPGDLEATRSKGSVGVRALLR